MLRTERMSPLSAPPRPSPAGAAYRRRPWTSVSLTVCPRHAEIGVTTGRDSEAASGTSGTTLFVGYRGAKRRATRPRVPRPEGDREGASSAGRQPGTAASLAPRTRKPREPHAPRHKVGAYTRAASTGVKSRITNPLVSSTRNHRGSQYPGRHGLPLQTRKHRPFPSDTTHNLPPQHTGSLQPPDAA